MKKYLSLLFLALAGVSPIAFAQTQIGSPAGLPTPVSITVTLSPSTIASNGGVSTLQATAVMSDTTQNPADQTQFCNWSSSNPAIASIQQPPANPGTYTASGVSGGTVTIGCTTSWGSGSATLRVSAPPLITYFQCASPPCALPAGTQSSPYVLQYLQSGGTAPISWSVTAGTLPTGLNLNSSSGLLSGTPSGTGTSPFTVGVSAGNGSASQSYTLLINPNAGCGAPNYACTPSNVNTPWAPVQIPFSGLGASTTGVDGTIVMIPEPGQPNGLGQNPQIRVSNGHTFCGAPSEPACNVANYLYDSACVDVDGSADGNHWNTDDTMFFICDSNSGEFSWLYSFNPSTLVPTFKYSNYSATGQALWGSKRPAFARGSDNHTLYGFADATNATAHGTWLWSWDVSVNYPSVPAGTAIADFSAGGQLFPTTYNFQGDSPAGDVTNTIFADGFANTSAAHSARFVAWRNTGVITSGVFAAAWNTSTGAYTTCKKVAQTTTCAGSEGAVVQCQNCGAGITNPGTFSIHNIRLSLNGNFVIVAPQACDAGVTCFNNGSEFAFDPRTGKVWATCGGASPVSCGGHWTTGYNYWFNNLQRGQETGRILTTGIQTPTKFPAVLGCPYPSQMQDQHLGSNNQDVLDDHYVMVTTSSESVLPDYTQCWTNELLFYAPPASAAFGTVKRMGHNNTGPTSCFDGQIANASISQDGNFTLFASTQAAGLGCTNGTTSCTVSTRGGCTNSLAPRADVFINKNQ